MTRLLQTGGSLLPHLLLHCVCWWALGRGSSAAFTAGPGLGSANVAFTPIVVDDKIQDGYFIQAVDMNNDGKLDILTSGLALGEVVWYENPSWKKRVITTLSKPVGADVADVDQDGYLDVIISHDYGNCMFNCSPSDGTISWLQNPGKLVDSSWKVHRLGSLMATHRLQAGHFTQPTDLEVMALPVVGFRGVHEPVDVRIYTAPRDASKLTQEWDYTVVNNDSFRIIHEGYRGHFGAKYGSVLQSMVLASEEGVTWIWYDENDPKPDKWKKVPLNKGEMSQYDVTHFKGSGSVAVCKLGSDDFAYMATAEPFHGNTIAFYSKDVDNDLGTLSWTRTVIEVLGRPNERGEAESHHVVCGDFDGDGDDEFLVALRGPAPYQGVLHFTVKKSPEGVWPRYTFARKLVGTSSAARIALGDFNGDGWLDFATISYYTPTYFLAENPDVRVYLNNGGGSGHQQAGGLGGGHVEGSCAADAQASKASPRVKAASFLQARPGKGLEEGDGGGNTSTLFPPGSIHLGIMPTGWVNDDFPTIGQSTYKEIMDEVALAGFEGGSVGHEYPKDPSLLKAELDVRGLKVTEPWTSTYFTVHGMAETTVKRFIESLKFIKRMGGNRLIVAELGWASHNIPVAAIFNKPVFNDTQWEALAAGLKQLGEIAKANDMELCYHHHIGTGVQNGDEIDRLMEITDPDLVRLNVDTGHAYFAGVDPLKLVQKYGKRIGHVHLKNVRLPVVQQAKQERLTFEEAVVAGVFTVPGDPEGAIDFEPILQQLASDGYKGWLVVEAEQDPSKTPFTPLQYAKMARAYLRSILGF